MPPQPSEARSLCPVACTLDILGDRWTLLVIRDLFCGRTRFSDFQRSPEGIATNILADRLQLLVDQALVEKRPNATGKRFTYHLTPRGQSLGPVLAALRDWGLEHIEGTEVRVVPE